MKYPFSLKPKLAENMKIVSSNGAQIPGLGFGTYKLEAYECIDMVESALRLGYRHIDTAQIYKNESEVGQGIKASELARESIFLTTKVWINRFRNGDLQRSVEASLEKLNTPYVDLLLLHWPNPEVPLAQTIKALNEVKNQGLAKNIGVSNFTSKLIKEAVQLSENPIVNNQVEYHFLLDQDPLLKECRKHGISLTAYSPLAQGKLLSNEVLKIIAGRLERSPAQVALRWLYQQDGVIAIPKTANKDRAQANLETTSFELSPEEMQELNALKSPNGRFVDPEGLSPEWD